MNFSTNPAACGETAPQKREQLQEKTVKLTFLGHACFLVQAGAHTLILDPFLTNSRTAAMRAADVEATHMLISHAHGDHIGDAAPIAERCGCTVFCTPETGAMLHAPHARQENGQPGGRIQTEFGSVKFLPAEHGSGAPGGVACGFLIEIGGKRIYFAGDTGLMADMVLLAGEEIDAALLPIGDRYTMGPEDAVRAAEMIQPRLVIPMHYDTFPTIEQDPQAFRRLAEEKTGIPVAVLKPGEAIML